MARRVSYCHPPIYSHSRGLCKPCADKLRPKRDRNQIIKRYWDVKNLYGLSSSDYDLMLSTQGGSCAICKKTPDGNLHVDHNHDTKKVRGLLCSNCNRGMGLLKDDPHLLAQAIKYLYESAA